MSITQVEATKISESLAKELEAMRALCKYHAGKAPSPYFRPVPDPSELNADDDPYPPQFYYFCNLVSVPRQIEIFRFSYFIHVEEMLEKLLSVIVERSLTEAALLFRYYLEVTASFFARADQIEEICKKLIDAFDGIGDPHDEQLLSEISQASNEIHTLVYPTSIDWRMALSPEFDEEEIKSQEKSFRIGKFLKKLERRIPSLPNLYSGCSEIIHPNAIPSLTAAEILGSDDNDKPSIRVMRFATDRKRMSEIYFDVFFMSLVGATGVNFLRDTNPILKEKISGLKSAEAKTMKKLRPLGRRYLNMSLNHSDLDCFENQLLCPCGSYKNYRKCCGHPRN